MGSKKTNEKCYCDRMPLQPNSQGFIATVGEVVHILRQLQALLEALGNSPTLTWGPVPYTGRHRKRFTLEHESCCHLAVGRDEEEDTLDPTCTVRCVPLTGSWMTMVALVGAEGVLGGVSSGLLSGWSVVRGLFRVQGAKRGWSLSWAGCCCIGGRPWGRNRLTIMFYQTTISSSAFLASALEEFTDSTSTWSAGWTSTRGSSTGIWIVRPWKMESADVSFTGSNESTLVS